MVQSSLKKIFLKDKDLFQLIVKDELRDPNNLLVQPSVREIIFIGTLARKTLVNIRAKLTSLSFNRLGFYLLRLDFS